MAKPLRTVIVEDVAADAQLVIHELRRAGFDADCLVVGTEAEYLTALEPPPDIIFSDYRLPGFNGLHLLQERGQDIPFILVTGSIEEDALRCMQQGADDYLLKDRLARLGPVVTNALERKSQRDARRRAEAELQATADRLAAILASTTDAIVTVDRDDRIILFNRAAEQVFGCPARDALGRPVTGLLLDWGAAEVAAPNAAVRGYRGRRTDGEEFPIEASLSQVETAGEQTTTIILRDVTEVQRARARVQESERLRALGEMASGIAHDFNNMLAIILGRCELLLGLFNGTETAARLDPHLDVIKQAARDGEETVKRLQTFSGISRRPASGAIDLGEVLRTVVEYTRPHWKDRAQQTGLTITVMAESEPLPPLTGNPAELREVLVNMVFNAVDAMPQGGSIHISAARRGNEVRVQVRDTGTGMPEDIRRRVFDPFFSTKGTRGSGLGLSMSYGIVSRLGGRIEVESAPGHGATFSIIFPFRPAEPDTRPAQPAAAFGGPLSILLVDDEVQILATTQLMLQVAGHRTTAAESGAEALALLAAGAHRFDVVLTDLGMPGMNGMQLLAAIRQAGHTVPCVLVTGWGIELAGADMEAAGAQAVLPKPFTVAQLREALEQVTGDRPQAIGKREE